MGHKKNTNSVNHEQHKNKNASKSSKRNKKKEKRIPDMDQIKTCNNKSQQSPKQHPRKQEIQQPKQQKQQQLQQQQQPQHQPLQKKICLNKENDSKTTNRKSVSATIISIESPSITQMDAVKSINNLSKNNLNYIPVITNVLKNCDKQKSNSTPSIDVSFTSNSSTNINKLNNSNKRSSMWLQMSLASSNLTESSKCRPGTSYSDALFGAPTATTVPKGFAKFKLGRVACPASKSAQKRLTKALLQKYAADEIDINGNRVKDRNFFPSLNELKDMQTIAPGNPENAHTFESIVSLEATENPDKIVELLAPTKSSTTQIDILKTAPEQSKPLLCLERNLIEKKKINKLTKTTNHLSVLSRTKPWKMETKILTKPILNGVSKKKSSLTTIARVSPNKLLTHSSNLKTKLLPFVNSKNAFSGVSKNTILKLSGIETPLAFEIRNDTENCREIKENVPIVNDKSLDLKLVASAASFKPNNRNFNVENTESDDVDSLILGAEVAPILEESENSNDLNTFKSASVGTMSIFSSPDTCYTQALDETFNDFEPDVIIVSETETGVSYGSYLKEHFEETKQKCLDPPSPPRRPISLDIKVAAWNFIDPDVNVSPNDPFPKFLGCFDDEAYLMAEKLALLGLKLALGNQATEDKFTV